MTRLRSLLVLSLLSIGALAQNPAPPEPTPGQACDIRRNRLNTETKKFSSDCGDKMYCAPDNTCKTRGCRRDEFPFGFKNATEFPPMCPGGKFCPDEGDQCLDIMPPGSTCQLNRDDQCSPPPDRASLETEMNHHGAMCFQFTCQYANLTLGQSCAVENIVYVGYGSDGTQWNNIVSRDRCAPHLWCNAQSGVCESTVQLGATCSAHKQCDSYTCGTNNYIITGIAIILIMISLSIGLFMYHKRSRAKKLREIREYFREQTSYRNSIITMHSNARSRISMYSTASRDSLAQFGGALGTRESLDEDNDQRGLLDTRQSTDSHRQSSDLRHSNDHDSDDEGVGHTYEQGPGVGGSVPLHRPTSRLKEEWNPGEWGSRR
ncbi:GTP-binding protein GTR2 [Ceratobasidium sp. AG-Ba]|nr:GTP-binding protein GTR2 [Ceratobasidium sp. AG-Ba]